MKRICLALASILVVAGSAFGQAPNLPLINRSYDGGVFYSPAYNYVGNPLTSSLIIDVAPAATGAGTITLRFGYVILPDGRRINPFTGVATLPPITISDGTTSETVTPSSASCPTPDQLDTCNLVATFANLHGHGSLVFSGDLGIQEAINDAASFGGGDVFWLIDPGSVTLATGAANTNLGSINIPTRSVVMGASARVTTTIATCAGGWSLGFSTGVEFTAANTTLTAGTTTDSSTINTPVVYNAAAGLPIAHCTTSNASAGALHARIWGYKHVASSF
jgi:hypothetical protein